ncbi:hypothetical protein OG462_09115 [Streptomyces sp. NBC_01077]|uniref:hypothetical protein n=1 Tax=Streptomyces sp. NBC_01077 TaxID=2903746 RepID=UPI00386F6C21|nr:hypothetical protein OG462_09115 [Streptomyces sp. NBC_01077]
MRLLWAAEVLFVLLGLVGVALVYLPASFVLGGVLGVLAVERALSGRREKT